MALYLVMFSAPAAHIDFMRKHPGTAQDYRLGEPPHVDEAEPARGSFLSRLLGRTPPATGPVTPDPPPDWPEDELDTVDMEINHRNVDLYHWILNQTPDPVKGAGSIFQTWFHRDHSALPLDDCNEDFAFAPGQLPELLALVRSVTPQRLEEAFAGWCVANGKDPNPSTEEVEDMHARFVGFGRYLETAIAKGHGLVWVVS